MFRNVNAIRRIVGALAVAAVLTTALPAEAAGSSRPAAPGFWESVVAWFGEWTGLGPVLEVTFSSSDAGPMIDPLGGVGTSSIKPESGPQIEPMGTLGSTSSE